GEAAGRDLARLQPRQARRARGEEREALLDGDALAQPNLVAFDRNPRRRGSDRRQWAGGRHWCVGCAGDFESGLDEAAQAIEIGYESRLGDVLGAAIVGE